MKANNCTKNIYTDWIDNHVNPAMYNNLIEEAKDTISNRGFKIRELPYGAILYDIDGISFTYFNYCIQDNSNGEDIRSLIYQEDGHLYTTWNSPASIIF